MRVLARKGLSSLNSKYLMAVTGLILIGFVLVHMAGNLLIYAGKQALNDYAKHLEELGLLLWVARAVLLAAFILHVLIGIRLWRQNRAARPIPYQQNDTVQASWMSRHMLLTGLVILAFVVYHLLHFSFGVIEPGNFKYRHDYQVTTPYFHVEPDVAEMVVRGFRQWWISVSYVVAQLFLGLHLWHGGGSWFQSLGLNRQRSAWGVSLVGPVLGVVVVAGNCSIPLAILLGFRPTP
jgi:succinate dehydrogenase / fumarate reductase cytochrome b subunit